MVCSIVVMPQVLLRTHGGQWELIDRPPTITIFGQQLYWCQIGDVYTIMHRIHDYKHNLIVCSKYTSGSYVDVNLHAHIAARVLRDEHLVHHNTTNMCLYGVIGGHSHLDRIDVVGIARKFAHISCAELTIYIDASTTVLLTIALHGYRESLQGWEYDKRSGKDGVHARFIYGINAASSQLGNMRALGIPDAFIGCEYFAYVQHCDTICDIDRIAQPEIAEIMIYIADDETRMVIMSQAAR